MKIISKADSVFIQKDTGVKTNYYLFPEYEVHYNEQLPGTEQDWHHHERISETLFIIEGELEARWREDGEEKTQVVRAGDIIQTENTAHTFKNIGASNVKFLVIKQVLAGNNHRELFKNDKVAD